MEAESDDQALNCKDVFHARKLYLKQDRCSEAGGSWKIKHDETRATSHMAASLISWK